MPAKQIIDIPWPIKGLSENAAYSQTPEGTTLDCLNVRPYDMLEKRLRGGQRTGLSKYFTDQVNGSNPVQGIEEVVQAFDPDSVIVDSVIFDEEYPGGFSTGSELSDQSDDWVGYDNIFATVDADGGDITSDGLGGAFNDVASDFLTTDLSPGDRYIVEATVNVVSTTGSEQNALEICWRVSADPTDRDYYLAYVDGPDFAIRRSTGGAYTGLDNENALVTTGAHTVRVEVAGTTVKVYWDDTLKFTETMGSHAGNTRFGFVYRGRYTRVTRLTISRGIVPASLRTTKLVVAAGGNVTAGTAAEGLTTPTGGSGAMASSGRVGIQPAFQNVFLCDGVAANYQYLDLDANEVKDWATDVTAGSLPAGSVDTSKACTIIALYRGRIVMSGLQEEPQNWFMSKSGDPFDWDYTPTTTTPIQAVAGNNSNVGELGDVVTAIAPFQDDVMLMGGANTLWIMRGDPAAGGAIDNISRQIGIVAPDAWTFDSSGTFYFFGSNGLYRLAPSGGSPELVSKGRLDRTFSTVDLLQNRVFLIYDREWQGVHIFFSPLNEPETASEHFFWDERTDSFWKDQYPTAHGPTAVALYNADDPENRAVLLGGYDGYLRFFDADGKSDDGTAITSRIRFAPIQPGSMFASSRVDELTFITDANGDDVTFHLFTGDTPEAADAAADAGTAPRLRKTQRAGRNIPMRQRIAQNTFVPVIEQTAAGKTWAYESGGATVSVLNRMHFKRV